MKTINYLKLFVILIGLFFSYSCKKSEETNQLVGIWDFNRSCNMNFQAACQYYYHRDKVETLYITYDRFIKKYEDSEVFSAGYIIIDTLIVFEEYNLAKQFIRYDDILILIDTCPTCNYSLYTRHID